MRRQDTPWALTGGGGTHELINSLSLPAALKQGRTHHTLTHFSHPAPSFMLGHADVLNEAILGGMAG